MNPSNFGGAFLSANLTVSQMCGTDQNGARNSGVPVRTLAKAKQLAQSGDTILVIDGTFTENDLAKHGVHWHFLPGAIVQYTDPGSGNGYGIFDDRAAAASYRVTGKGTFKYTLPTLNVNNKGGIVITNAASRVHFQCARIEIGYGFGAGTQAAFSIDDCALVHLDVDEIIDLDYANVGETSPAMSGIYWKDGDVRGRVGYMQVAQYCLYSQEPAGSPTASIFMRGEYWESAGNAFYQNLTAASNSNYRTWLEVQEIKGATCIGVYGGRCYVTSQKLSSTAGNAVDMSASGELWLNAQKISHNAIGINTIAGWTGKLYGNVLHFEDIGAATDHCKFAGTGTVYLSGEVMVLTAGQCVEVVGAGSWNIRGYRMEVTTNAAANDTILLGATSSGLVLNNCVLVCGAAAQSIELAAARTITNYGSVAKRAVSVAFALTTNVQAILVDANVV